MRQFPTGLTDDEIAAGVYGAKAAAIRRAIACGYRTPRTATAWIRRTFGLYIADNHFSAGYSRYRYETDQIVSPRRRETRIPIHDVVTLRRLIVAYGAPTLKQLIAELA